MKQSGALCVDDSNIVNGVITVRSLIKSKKKTKVLVEARNHSISYDIYSAPIVIPLQFSHGAYTVTLNENTTGNKYRNIGSVRLVVKIINPMAPYLLPNVYVNYTDQSACVQKAGELCSTCYADEYRFNKIRGYIDTHYKYSFLHALIVSGKNYLPQIDKTFERGWGICQDLAAMAAAMLRSQGVPAKLIIGLANQSAHAWVQVFYRNGWHLYDPTKAIRNIKKNYVYTEQRWY